MADKSWHLDRRTFLRGTGVSLGLPWMECMSRSAHASTDQGSVAKRLCALYFGFGVGLPKEDSDQAKWRWFPSGEGKEFQFTETLQPLEKHRNRVSVLGGLSHPNGRRMGAHDTGDTFLTGLTSITRCCGIRFPWIRSLRRHNLTKHVFHRW